MQRSKQPDSLAASRRPELHSGEEVYVVAALSRTAQRNPLRAVLTSAARCTLSAQMCSNDTNKRSGGHDERSGKLAVRTAPATQPQPHNQTQSTDIDHHASESCNDKTDPATPRDTPPQMHTRRPQQPAGAGNWHAGADRVPCLTCGYWGHQPSRCPDRARPQGAHRPGLSNHELNQLLSDQLKEAAEQLSRQSAPHSNPSAPLLRRAAEDANPVKAAPNRPVRW